MLFAPEERPTLTEIRELLEAPELAGFGASVSYAPDPAQGWAELLVNGLTFDLSGLAPHPPQMATEPQFRFNVPEAVELSQYAALSIVPGDHLRTAMPVMPMVRAMTALVANLSLPLQARAVYWRPAGSAMEPGYFARIVMNWQAGGVFPALGLTGLKHREDGAVETSGLAWFIGQEALIPAAAGEDRAETAKLAIRVIDYLIANGKLEEVRQLAGQDGEALEARPTQNGEVVRIVRSQG